MQKGTARLYWDSSKASKNAYFILLSFEEGPVEVKERNERMIEYATEIDLNFMNKWVERKDQKLLVFLVTARTGFF